MIDKEEFEKEKIIKIGKHKGEFLLEENSSKHVDNGSGGNKDGDTCEGDVDGTIYGIYNDDVDNENSKEKICYVDRM